MIPLSGRENRGKTERIIVDIDLEAVIIIEKGADRRANGSPWFMVTDQKSNQSLWAGAVAFLMLLFRAGLPDTEQRDNNTDESHDNTDNAYSCF